MLLFKTYQLSTRPEQEQENDVAVMEEQLHKLIIWNDDVNTFDWVIESLMAICDHSFEQAEQAAMLIHYKGKYAVKHGDLDTLLIMCEALIDRGINATIDD